MPGLMRTPIQHVSNTIRALLLTPVQTLAPREQGYRSAPHSQPIYKGKSLLGISSQNMYTATKLFNCIIPRII